YDISGRVSRIYNLGNGSATAYLYEYDDAGNLAVKSSHTLSPTGELLAAYQTQRFTFDTKRNPLYGLGSFLYNYHMNILPTEITYFSPNNVVAFVNYGADGTPSHAPYEIKYTYNGNGYPVQVEYGGMAHRLEYTAR